MWPLLATPKSIFWGRHCLDLCNTVIFHELQDEYELCKGENAVLHRTISCYLHGTRYANTIHRIHYGSFTHSLRKLCKCNLSACGSTFCAIVCDFTLFVKFIEHILYTMTIQSALWIKKNIRNNINKE